MVKRLGQCAIALLFAAAVNGSAIANSSALHFSGNDWIEVPDSPGSVLDITGSVTLEAWVRFQNYPNCCWNSVAGKTWSHRTEDTSYWLMFSNHEGDPTGNSAYGSFGVDGVAQVHADASAIRDNAWHHLAIVLDDPADETRLYIDGLLASTGIQTAPIPVTDFSFYIANAPGHDRRTFEGDIDEVRLWNLARSGTEILNAMSADLTGHENGLVGYWNFSESSGDIAHDRTGNGNNGFFAGSPTWISDAPLLVAIPEPPTIALAAVALILIAAIRRRSRFGFCPMKA
jgi:hypothetical protein